MDACEGWSDSYTWEISLVTDLFKIFQISSKLPDVIASCHSPPWYYFNRSNWKSVEYGEAESQNQGTCEEGQAKAWHSIHVSILQRWYVACPFWCVYSLRNVIYDILNGACRAEKSVNCELDKKVKVGKVLCTVCGEEWCVVPVCHERLPC